MAGEGIFNFLGQAGKIASGVNTWNRLFKGDVLGAISGGFFGGDKLSPARQELDALGFDSFRDFGAQIVPQSNAIKANINKVLASLTKYNVPKSDRVWQELPRIREAINHATSPADAIARNQAGVTAAANAIKGLAFFNKTKAAEDKQFAETKLRAEQEFTQQRLGRRGIRGEEFPGAEDAKPILLPSFSKLAFSPSGGSAQPSDISKISGEQMESRSGKSRDSGEGRVDSGSRSLRLPRPSVGREARFPQLNLQLGDIPGNLGGVDSTTSEIGRFPVQTDIVPSGRPSLAQQKVKPGKKRQLFSETPHILS